MPPKRRLSFSPRQESYEDWACRTEPVTPARVDAEPICIICLESIDGSDWIAALDCLHIFHCSCFEDAMVAFINRCPLCLSPLVTFQKPEKAVIATRNALILTLDSETEI